MATAAKTYMGVPIKRMREKGVSPRRKIHNHPKIKPETVDRYDWYALRVSPQTEFVTQDILKQRGILTYVPVRKEWRFRNKFDKAKKQKKLMSYPESVGYVFMASHKGFEPNWLMLGNTNNINGVVGVNGIPRRISCNQLHNFVKAFPNGIQRPAYEKHMNTGREFKVGDTVRPASGPFQHVHINVVEITDSGKVPFIVEMFGKDQSFEFEAWDLELVEAAE